MREVLCCVPWADSRYRYLLRVALFPDPTAGPRLAVILKNPSMASATRSDPTVGKVESWARDRGFGSVAVVNLFALRAVHPTLLNAQPYDVMVGPDNDRSIALAAAEADVLVAGWGNPNGIEPLVYDRRIGEVLSLLDVGRLAVAGPLTKTGYPRHGLLWNHNVELSCWPGAAVPPGRGAYLMRPSVPRHRTG